MNTNWHKIESGGLTCDYVERMWGEDSIEEERRIHGIEGRNPSNMDVVLVGTDRRSGKPVVLLQLHIGNDEECLASYQKKYIILADVLNKQLKKDGISDKFTVLSDILSYSQFKDKEYIQEPQVKRFYFELGK